MAQTQDGSLLVTDDKNGLIYRFAYTGTGEDTEDTEGDGAPRQPTNAEGAKIRMNARDSQDPSQPAPLSQLATQAVSTGNSAPLSASSSALDSGASITDMYGAERHNISPPV